MKTVAFIITRSDVIGGASIHLLDLAISVKNSGYYVSIYVGGTGVFIDRARSLGLECISLKYLTREITPYFDVLSFFELRRALKNRRPDLVHAHSSKAGIIGRLASYSLNIPSVFTAHGWAFTEGVSFFRRHVYKSIEWLMSGITAGVITVSEYDRQLALKAGIGKRAPVVRIHNGIADKVEARDKKRSAVKLIMVARFEEPKDHLSLLCALSHIANESWELDLVGDGPLLKVAFEYAQNIGISEKVNFLGTCNDVSKRLFDSDVFLLVSNREGFPLTILEAMQASLPVIASNVGGIQEAVLDGVSGLLVERGDTEGLELCITQLIGDEEKRKNMGRKGRYKFEQEFTLSVMRDKTLSVYAQVLGGKA